MNTLAAIVVFTLLGGVLSAAIAGLFLLLPERRRVQSLPHMVSFATGALLGAALLALVPHAVMGAGLFRVHDVGIALVAGIGLFFVLEKFLLWRHCHSEDFETHDAHEHHRRQASGVLVLAGDAFHNALDGVLIAAAFLTDFHLGIVTALAIMAHEIPQEVGNFAVLLHAGMGRARAFALNVATSLTAVVGGVVGYFFLREAMGLLPYALAIAASSLLYVAVADLIPGLHRQSDTRASLMQVMLIGLGILVVSFAESHAH
ncbi:MAG: ZIP family metal transporter [Steroidobacteraceae bacterium]